MGSEAGPASGVPESDFSFRKIRLATIILIAQMFATSLLPFAALTLVMMPMTQELGWTPTQFSFAMTALMWFGGITNPFYGRFFDTVGVRLPVMLGTLGVAGVTFALSFQTSNIWTFYLVFALLGMFGSSAIGYSKVIGALFTQHRGKAYAILGIESTLAGAGLPPLLAWLISEFGWRGMFMTCSFIIVAMLPILYFTLDEPGTIGGPRRLFPKRDSNGAAVAPPRPPELEGLTAPQVMRDKVFWLIVIATIIGMAPRSGMMPYLVPMLLEKGFTERDAVTYMSITTLVAPLGTLAAGYFVDKIQDARIAVPFKAASFVGLFLFALATSSFGGWPLLMAGVAFGGFAFGTTRPITTYMHIRFFGLKSFGFYYGFEMMLVAFALGIAAPGIGYLAEATGGYRVPYIVILVSLALGAIAYLFMGPYRFAADTGAIKVAPRDDQAEGTADKPASADGGAVPAGA